MSKKKIFIFVFSLITLIVLYFAIKKAVHINQEKNLYSNITIGCSAALYEQKSDFGYLTVITDEKSQEIVIKTEDIALQNELKSADLSDIIGINLILKIPYEIRKEKGITTQNINPFELLTSGLYNDYTGLQDVFYTTVDK